MACLFLCFIVSLFLCLFYLIDLMAAIIAIDVILNFVLFSADCSRDRLR